MLMLVVIISFVVSIIGIIIKKKFWRSRRVGEPAIVPGNLVLGCAGKFSKNAVHFLQNCQDKYGDVFTIRLLHQHLTIIMDPNCYEEVTREKNFDFDPIQKQVNWNVFSFVLKEPRKMLKETGKSLRAVNLPPTLDAFCSNLNFAINKFQEKSLADENGWVKTPLREFTAHTVFDAIFVTIFGRQDEHVFNSELVFANLEKFHKYFNYMWLGIPRSLFKEAVAALNQLLLMPNAEELLDRSDLHSYLRIAINNMIQQGQTDADIKGHNLVYLHVNYNTFRVSYWLLNNLLFHPEAIEALQSELDQLISAKLDSNDNSVNITLKELEDLPILNSIVEETCRLSSGVFMVRYILEDAPFITSTGQKFLMRGGDRVAIYPPAIHKHPQIFEDPLTFKYDRFIDAKFTDMHGRPLTHPVMAFGTICPGKRFALAQIKLFALNILLRFKVKPQSGQTSAAYDTKYYGHEVLPPVSDVQVFVKPKSDCPFFKLTQ